MPEMPEVQSLARWLSERTRGLVIEKVDLLAISALYISRAVSKQVGAVRGFRKYARVLLVDARPVSRVLKKGSRFWAGWFMLV